MKAVAFTAVLLFALTGCSDPAPSPIRAPEGQPDADPAPAAPAVPDAPSLPTIAHGSVLDFAVGDEKQQAAMPLFGDQSVAATVVSSSAGDLVGVGVLIGNYGDTSRGGVDLEVCLANECRKTSIDAASTVDNQILAFPVEPALPIQAGSELKLNITRQTGGNEFAIWTFPVADQATRLDSSDPAFKDRTARIQLLLK